ncbi:hypothetical protein GCM10018962_77400 [Dactylosporangium matsuzakiense]|uniref:hypothetical protein n=1 Tax=Dactylosporangium matsuzakiense TaxID=53360 RepID=UPI0031E63786
MDLQEAMEAKREHQRGGDPLMCRCGAPWPCPVWNEASLTVMRSVSASTVRPAEPEGAEG